MTKHGHNRHAARLYSWDARLKPLLSWSGSIAQSQAYITLQLHATGSSDLLQLPFLGKFLVQLLQLVDQVAAGLDNGLLRRNTAISLHTQLECREERVRNLVGDKYDVLGLGQLCT